MTRQRNSLLSLFLLLFLYSRGVASGSAAPVPPQTDPQRKSFSEDYVGSKLCAQCHQLIYNSFSRTDMGRSMSTVTPAVLKELPNSASLFNPQQNRHFNVFVKDGHLYQSEWEVGESGKEIFRETERVEWIIGAGANAVGGIVQRGDRLFEAPLTFYKKTQAWALSPGYEDEDRGFSRPTEAECIVCHSARPNPVGGATGEFRNPPFDELAMGCENCHGPGAMHVREMQEGKTKPGSANHSIVNPAKLSPWLADNICMSCHQNGDARVLQPGKAVQDFRPGQPLDNTLAILMAPPTRESPPDSDHVQHYFSMTLSKCYRSSKAKLSCITCHDPHVQPRSEQVSAHFKEKCLGCHTEDSCALSHESRRHSVASDDCIACHMPKRDVTVISHASLTNHRIVGRPSEPFPDITFQLTTTALPDLVHLNAIPGEPESMPPALTLLQAYGQLAVAHREYLQRYFEVAEQLESTEPNNLYVLEALAARSLQQASPDGEQTAMEYLTRAIREGSTSAWDFEQLGSYLIKDQRFQEALSLSQEGIRRAPYDPKLYALLAESYVSINRPGEAAATLREALKQFPQMDLLRELLNEVQQNNSPQKGTDDSQR
jgi:predicted CXXCH cytochrome family protein